MNKVKTIFSIKDLENLSGIKAHTIRIWEKRYNLLFPNRTDTNIRYYTLKSLQKLLNITLLYNNGVKISKISRLTDDQIISKCRSIISKNAIKNLFINDLKLAMLNFDQTLFENSYQKLIEVIDFKEVYINYFIPFLGELGLLWSTDAITPAHEHFITALIKQKILVQTEKLQTTQPKQTNTRFVLFLPENEIHDIGLSFTNYEIIRRGYPSIYLGQSIPISCLDIFTKYEEKVVFITYFTVEPSTEKIPEYLKTIHNKIILASNSQLWVLGRKTKELKDLVLPKPIKFLSMPEMIKALDNLQLIF